jgi:hypothetical protein
MSEPCRAGAPLSADLFARLRRRAAFACCKWDTQVEDVPVLCPFPVLLDAAVWRRLAGLAERLAAEAQEAEDELAARPELHGALGLPRQTLAALRRGAAGPAAGPRCVRFDFHPTADGWRLSEANTDVPGGHVEAGGLAALVAGHYPGTTAPPCPAAALARALAGLCGPGACVALAHATAYTDDLQVMAYLARRLAEAGLRGEPVSPAHLRWREGRAVIEADWQRGPAAAVVRFFPAEWLPNLPAACGWPTLFAGARVPLTNPATALLTQSKRFPLTWPWLRAALPTWKALLPETRDPREAPWETEDWVAKPALGRVGEGVGLRGVTGPLAWEEVRRAVRSAPGEWAVQKRFQATPLAGAGEPFYPCFGVFTVAGRPAGVYGRVARRPLIDGHAQDAAVLLDGAAGGDG